MAGLFDGFEQLPGLFGDPIAKVVGAIPRAPGILQQAMQAGAGALPAVAQPSRVQQLLSGLQTAIAGRDDPTLSADANKQARNAALMRAGIAMLANSGPSTQPVGLGQILASGLMAGQQGGAEARQSLAEKDHQDQLQKIVQSGAGLPQLQQLFQQAVATGDHQGATALATVIQSMQAAESKGQGNLQRFQGPDGQLYTFDPRTGDAKPIAGPDGNPMAAPAELESKDLGDKVIWYPKGHPERIVHIQRKGSTAASRPNLQVVQTADGLAAFNPQTGMLEPITGQNGAQVKPKSTASAALVKAAAANRKQMSSIDTAIADLQAHPSAIGLTRFSDAVNQRVDPEGVKARAGLADIGSMIIHDRSGAAVTAKEFPRLNPFIPNVKDTPRAALIKLRRMKQILQEETSALQTDGNYSPDNPFAP